MTLFRFASAALALLAGPQIASAVPVFFGPTPYLSSADIPAGFYAVGPAVLENFEDAVKDSSLVTSAGAILAPSSETDSVDGDDGAIDGSGAAGRSWFFFDGGVGVTITFNVGTLPTAAGVVWTDGLGTTTFEAFGPGMVSLGTIGPVMIADGFLSATTAEDRFFGVQDASGILAIKLTNSIGGIELDHIQYGDAGQRVAEPAGLALLAAASLLRRRRAQKR